jgi:hypothetical protein
MRLLSIAMCAVLGASAAQAADETVPGETQLPQQVLPTGAEDAAAAAPAARMAVASVSSDELIDQLIESTSESDEGLVIVDLPSGGQMIDLQGRFMTVMVATPTDDGGVVVGCHTGHDAVEHAKHAHAVADGKAAPVKAVDTKLAPQALEEK